VQSVLFTLIALGLLLAPAMTDNPAHIGMLIKCGIASVLAMGWLLILRIGCVSLGQVAFLAIGAYSSALFSMKMGMSPWLGLLLGGLMAGIAAFVLGVVFLRVRGFSLAIITFAFAEIVRLTFSNLTMFGGHGGILDIPSFPSISIPFVGPISFDSSFSVYYIMLLVLFVSALVMWRMDKSALGRTFRSISQNEDLVQSLGVYPLKYKLMGFVTAGFFGGVAGAFSAHYYGILTPHDYTVMASIFVQIQATVGGVYSVLWGGLLGASLMVTFETQLLKVDYRLVHIFYGSVIILVTFFLPDGLLSLPGKVKKRLKSKLEKVLA